MKNNDQFFKNAIKKMNLEIEKRSGISFSFNSFKMYIKIYFSKLSYKVMYIFSDKIFHDAFILSVAIHLIFILLIIIYTVVSGSSYSYKKNKQEKIIIFDISDLKVDKQNILPKLKTKTNNNESKAGVTKSKRNLPKKNKVKTFNSVNPKHIAINDSNNKKTKQKNINNKVQSEIKKITDDLLIDVKKGIKAENIDDITVPAGVDSSTGINSDELQISYINAIKFRVQNCWNIDAGIKGIKNIVIKISVNLFKSGYVKNINVLNSHEYNGLSEFNVVADSAKRAIISCAPYKFSPDRYDFWKTVNFNFYPANKSIE